jgi:hypothetical protein
MNLNIEARARAVLKQMTKRQLQRSLKAFPMIPAGERPESSFACFLGYAYREPGESFYAGYARGNALDGRGILEDFYEGGTERANWLHQEVIRELAERGRAKEKRVRRAPAEVAP